MNCVIVKTGALGDIVRTSFLVNALFLKYKYNISWIVKKDGIDLLKFNSNIYKVIDVDSDNLPLKADLVISLDDEFEYARIASNIQTRKLIGAFVKDEDVQYTQDVSLWFDMGLTSKFGKERADVLKKTNRLSHCEIFKKIFDLQSVSPSFYGDPVKNIYWESKKNKRQKIIGFNLFSGDRWPSKELDIPRYISLINKIYNFLNHHSLIFNFVLFSDINSLSKASEIKLNLDFLSILNTSQSILDFSAAINTCDYIISTDSLGLHLAIAQNVPNLSFYAPTSADEIETFGNGVKIKSTSEDYCSYKKITDNSSLTSDAIFNCWRAHFENIYPSKIKYD